MTNAIKLVECDVNEAFHLLRVLENYLICGSFEFNRGRPTDPYITVTDSYVATKYQECEGGDDYITVSFGNMYIKNMDINFDIRTSRFAKHITNSQIFIYVHDEKDDTSLWFDSDWVSPRAIAEAKSYSALRMEGRHDRDEL